MPGFIKKGALITALMALLFSCAFLQIRAKAAKDPIRVGYIDCDGFFNESNGTYSGYGVEYLEKIAEYTGWEYEYVHDTWDNCMTRLEEGDLDILCPAQYTEERAERFIYPKMPLGYESTVLYVLDDADLYYEDFEFMDGKRVGLLDGNFQTEAFDEYAGENGFTYVPVQFSTETEIIEALQAKEIDMMAVGSLARHSGLRVVGHYGAEPFYCITNKNKEDLIVQINKALADIRIDNPGFGTELHQRYYGDGQISSSPMFTREEREYIANSGSVTVRVMQGYSPMSYEKNGESAGILVEYIKLLAEKSGLNIQTVADLTPANIREETSNLSQKDFLIIRSFQGADTDGLLEGMLSTRTMIRPDMVYVMQQKGIVPGKTKYVYALTQEMKYIEDFIYQDSPDHTIIYYENPEDCLNAVAGGKADIAIQYSYVVAYLMQKPYFSGKLMETPGFSLQMGLCLVGSENNQMLINILDKTINYITSDEVYNIILKQVLLSPYQNTFWDNIYEFYNILIAIVVFLVILAFFYRRGVKRMAGLEIEKREYEFLQRQVVTDELTGVYNRKGFYEKVKEMIDATEENMCIVAMDINNFKVVNDLYGMESGDRLLQGIAQDLQKLGEGRDFLIARFSADHFYLCMKQKDFNEIHLTRHLKTFLEDMEIKADYGVFMVNDNRDVPVNIMCDRANLAVHGGDSSQMGYVRFYNDEVREKILRTQEIENEMERALTERQFCIFVQPKYDISTNMIIGGEALVRWIHPDKGMISPEIFISIFEQNGFILRLDHFIWEETCRFIRHLKDEGIMRGPISINVSRAHLYGTELKKKLEGLIEKYALSKEDLELEITETIYADNPKIIYKRIQEVQEAGFKIAMDDFGSGYSSLNMLKEMPLDILKMDLKFLDGGEDIERSHRILQTLIYLAHSLRLKVVVEGVETKEQVDFLKDIGSNFVQGFYYSRPVNTDAYEDMLRGSFRQ